MKTSATIALTIALILVGTPAFAATRSEKAGHIAFTTFEILLTVSGASVAFVNMIHAARGVPPRRKFLNSGYTMSTLNLITGALILGLSNRSPKYLGWGLGNLAVGALGIGFTVWGETTQRKYERQIRIVPVVGPGPSGAMSYGVGVNLVGF